MKRKALLLLTLSCVTLFFTACSSGCTSQQQQEAEAPSQSEPSAEYFESGFGYTLKYDAEIFYVLTDSASDSFGLCNVDAEAFSLVHVTVQRVSGYTVKEYTDILTENLDNGAWTVTESPFGAEQKSATTVSYEEAKGDDIIYHADTLVQADGDLLVVEKSTVKDLPPEIDNAIDDMLNTFTVTQ